MSPTLRHRQSRAARAALLITALVPGLASAQTTAGPEVVTAAPLIVPGERVRDDTAAITRVALGEVPAAQATLDQLTAEAPNLSVASGGARGFGDMMMFRGMGNTPFFGPPAVTLYLDDLPIGRTFMFPVELVGADSAELCRSPASNTRFGLAGSAGVLHLVTAPPATEPSGDLRVSLGNFNARRIVASADLPAGDDFDVSLGAAYAERDGYVNNTELNQRVDDRESLSARARARWRVTDELALSLHLTGTRARDGAQPFVPLGGPFFTVERGREGETNVDAWNAAFTLSRSAADGRLSATTSYTYWNLDPYSNRLILPPAFDSFVTQKQTGWSEEVQYARDLADRIAMRVGLYWGSDKVDGTVNRELPGLFPIEASDYITRHDSAALFGELAIGTDGPWSFTPGVRLVRTATKFDRTETVPTPGNYRVSQDSTALLPQLVARRDLTERVALQFSVGATYKPGGYSAFTGNSDLARFGPERSKTGEVALTYAADDDVFSATARAFWYEIDDYQIERSFTFTDYLVVNAPRARSRGIEIESTWRPRASWIVTSHLGYTDVTLREFVDPFTDQDFAGNRAPYAPEFDAHLAIDYAPASGWFAGASLAAVGRTYFDEGETAMLAQSSHVLVGAHFGYATERYRVTAFGENLFDDEYYTSINPGVGHGTPGAPRVFGVEAGWRF